MKRELLLTLTALLLAPLAGLRAADGVTPAKPNIILVMPDDLGYGDYACLGNPITHTPSVDAFKKESLLFTQFHVSPTCSPTRSALMSGRHEFKNGVTHTILERERMSLKTFTLPQMLKSAGYTTGIFGKWHLGDETAYRPENRGFDEVYIHGGGGMGQTYPGSCGDAPGNSNIDPTLWHNGKFEKTTGYCTDLFFAQAIKWMDARRAAKQPFFAYIPLNSSHHPLVVPEKYYQQYLGKPGISEQVAKFFGMNENVDSNFGSLLKQLRDWGIESNTLVIYIGTDNGGTEGVKIFNAGMKGQKGSVNQGGTRAPAFFRWPAGGIHGGTECAALSAHMDIFPTLAEIAGAKLSDEVKQQVEGRSLLPLLKDPQADWPDRLLVHHAGRWAKGKAEESKYRSSAIQNSRFTLVNNAELYDLKADPGEQTNVIADHPEVVASLRAAYDRWWTDVQPFLVNENVTDAPKINPMKELYWKQFGGGPDARMLKRMDPGSTDGAQCRCRQFFAALCLAHDPVGHPVPAAPLAVFPAPVGLVGHHHLLVALDHVLEFTAILHAGAGHRHMTDQCVRFIRRNVRLVAIMNLAVADREIRILIAAGFVSRLEGARRAACNNVASTSVQVFKIRPLRSSCRLTRASSFS